MLMYVIFIWACCIARSCAIVFLYCSVSAELTIPHENTSLLVEAGGLVNKVPWYAM